MDPWILGVIAGGTAALAVLVAQRRGSQSATTQSVLTLLRDRGPLTIPEMMDQLGLSGFSEQGRLVMALDSLIRGDRVAEQPVPATTPTLERINVRKYILRAAAGDPQVLPVLRARGPMTVPELMRATGLTGFSGQGKIVTALSSLVDAKKVIEHPIPDETPARERMKFRRYEARV
jgi:hypothetical protein